jgi:hypothetical protein
MRVTSHPQLKAGAKMLNAVKTAKAAPSHINATSKPPQSVLIANW